MRVDVVMGLGFGDEGKGISTARICKNRDNPLVVRYGGGHQVGHSVGLRDEIFVHSNTGSGTLVGAPTYYSEYTVVDIAGTLEEVAEIEDRFGIAPKIFYHPKAMIVTPLDVAYNRIHARKGGTVGVGFGATIERNESHYRLRVVDLKNEFILRSKLEQIINYYRKLGVYEELNIDRFVELSERFIGKSQIKVLTPDVANSHDLVFEGHQGILLDKEHGIFPHVTRSKTTAVNAYKILESIGYTGKIQEWYVTRPYSTRHGNGAFMEDDSVVPFNNEHEINVRNKWQGRFRVGRLSEDLVKYAINANVDDCISFNNRGMQPIRCGLITCLDQVNISTANRAINIMSKFCGMVMTKDSPFVDTPTK